MRFPPLIEAKFLRRVNRFVCEVEIDGCIQRALIRNTGRLKELLYEGNKVFVKEKNKGKYGYEILLASYGKNLVCIDSQIPPKLLKEAVEKRNINYGTIFYIKLEPNFGGSRFDLFIDSDRGRFVIETKSVNLVKNGVGLFPDAPTERGRKHIRKLMDMLNTYRAEVIFIIQREDAVCFAPNGEVDESFKKILIEFKDKGGTVKAYKCRVSLKSIYIDREVPLCF